MKKKSEILKVVDGFKFECYKNSANVDIDGSIQIRITTFL